MNTPSEVVEIHLRFCASMARAVFFRRVEVVLAYTAVVLPLVSKALEHAHLRRYLPLAVVLIGVGSVWTRYRSGRERTAGAACKQHVVRGFGYGDALAPTAAANVLETVAPLGGLLARFDRPKPLDEYYTVTMPPGPARVLEMYAESAFFTSRLHRRYSRTLIATSIVLAALAVVGFYVAAIEVGGRPVVFDRVGELLLSGVVVSVVLSTVQRGLDAMAAARSIATIEERLLELDLFDPDRDELAARVRDYEAEVNAAPLVSPIFYGRGNERLSREWSARRGLVWKSRGHPLAPAVTPAGANP
jgi:hypothetical protein